MQEEKTDRASRILQVPHCQAEWRTKKSCDRSSPHGARVGPASISLLVGWSCRPLIVEENRHVFEMYQSELAAEVDPAELLSGLSSISSPFYFWIVSDDA